MTNSVQKSKVKPSVRAVGKAQRGHLSREIISAAGLRVARSDGVENLTMKRLAEELSVTPMAIYRHYDDKSDLIDAVLERFVQENNICGHSVAKSDWSEWLLATYSKMYHGLQSMPSVYPYLSSASRFGPEATDVVVQTLEVMQSAGFSIERATQAANTLNGFVIGCAIMDNAFYKNLAHAKQDVPADLELGLDPGLGMIITALQYEYESNLQNQNS